MKPPSNPTAPVTISVVTVCFNAAATIEDTLRSVAAQQDATVEYVVVDGGSTDGTLEILQRHRGLITRLISERDAGIFDAMNKSLGLATGDVIYFLNADDSFVDPFVLRDITHVFEEDASRLLVYGNVVFREAPDNRIYGPAKAFVRWTIGEFLDNSFCHQAIFARRSLFDAIGGFDVAHRYSADYEWVIKAFRHNRFGFHYVDRLIANYFFRGRSFANADATRKEVRGHYLKHLRSFEMLRFYLRYVVIRGFKKRLLREDW